MKKDYCPINPNRGSGKFGAHSALKQSNILIKVEKRPAI